MNTNTEQAVAETEIPVRYEVAGRIIDVEDVNRAVRLMLRSQTKKLRKKFKHLKGVTDEQGRQATIVIRLPKLGVTSLECIIEYPEGFTDQIAGSEKATRIS